MSRRKKFSFRIPALRKAFRRWWEPKKRKLEKFSTGFSRSFSALMQVRESSVSLSSEDRRKLPTGLSYINPIFWIVQCSVFFYRYVQTRQAGVAIRAIPAIVGLLLPIALELRLAPGPQELEAATRSRLSAAWGQGELERAEFLTRKLASLVPDDAGVQMNRVRVLDRMGRTEEAERLAAELGNRFEYVPAVEWLSEKQFAAIVRNPVKDEAADKTLEVSLAWILQRQPENGLALFRFATFHMLRQQWLDAQTQLRLLTGRVGGAPAEAWYSLAVVEKELGNTAEARTAAETAVTVMRQRNASQEFSSERLVQVIRALVLAQKESDAVRQINEVATKYPELVESLRPLLVEVYVAHSSRLRLLSARSSEDLAIAIDCVAKAMEIAPESTPVTDELVALAGLRDVSDVLLDQQLQTALNAGVSPGLVHFILGTRAMSATPPDIESAMQHFALTATHNPGMPGLLNNLADAICEQPDGNLEQALVLVNQAIAFLPDQPRVFDTRGKIYLRQKEWLKAIADFEKALADEDLRLLAHERLAEAYEGLGNGAQAGFHRGMAKVLREQQKPDVASGAVPTPPPGE